MVVEKFTQDVINSGLFRLYIATGFFAIVIFFTVNADLFTPLEMILGVIGTTVVLKGISNMMLSMIVSFFSLENKKSEIEFNYNEEKIDAMLNELNVQDIMASNEKAKTAS